MVTAADRPDPTASTVSRKQAAASAERRQRRTQRTRATLTRSSHDLDVAGTAGRCCSRTLSVAPSQAQGLNNAVYGRPLPIDA
jgi:hypothetical protein